jgi:hypothetical protein
MLFFLALGLGAMTAYWVLSGTSYLLTVEEIVSEAAKSNLAADVVLSSEFFQEQGPWTLVCGEVFDLEGHPISDPRAQVGLTPFESSNYCALLENRAGKLELTELDIGSTDMPAMDWMQEHQFPMDLLSEQLEN